MKPIDAYNDISTRARRFTEYHDGLINTRARGIRRDWKASFLSLMRWPQNSAIGRVDSRDSLIILKPHAALTEDHFTGDFLGDQLRSALTFGVSALDRYVHERVVKGIIAAFKTKSRLNRQQEELPVPATVAMEIAQEVIKARKAGGKFRPANIVRKKLQTVLHRRPFQTFRDVDYAFCLLGITNLKSQLIQAYRARDGLKAVTLELGRIAAQRNQIVHEGHLVKHSRGGHVKCHPVTAADVKGKLDFLDTFVGHLENVT